MGIVLVITNSDANHSGQFHWHYLIEIVMSPTEINIPGFGEVSIDELREDVKSAIDKGLSNKWAFTPETVQGLINKIDELLCYIM